MTKLILVPLDGSPFGARALSLAASLARRNDAELHLVHVHDRPVQLLGAPANDLRFDREMEELMGREITALTERLRRQTHLPITSAMLEGPVPATLVQHIDATRPWLVVMSSHGRGGVRRMVAGNVADALARHAGVPVLIERWASSATRAELLTTEPVFRNILLPLDGSDLADDIVDYAAQLGDPGQTTFTLLRVVVPTPDFAPQSPAPPMRAANVEIEGSRSEALTYFGRVASTLKQRGFLAMLQVVVSPQPAEAILAFAAEHPTDLIALSTHGDGGFTRVVLGSVADKVMRGADVAVLLHGPTHEVLKEEHGVLAGSAHHS